MPRSNIPFRSKGYFSNRKRNRFFRSHIRSSADTESVDNPPTHVNNIVVFPKYSETTINFLSNNTKILPYGNLLRKIKGRKRKDKQRLKKKQSLEEDVKPVIKKMKTVRKDKMQPRLNQHIIFLSDSENENQDAQGNSNQAAELKDSNEKKNQTKENYDDDVIFVETPAPEIIEIEDSIEPNETPNIAHNPNERTSSPDDFLDKAHVNLRSKFDLESDSSEFKRTEFVKPSSAPIDMSESGSISSVSDVSASVGMNVFKLIDFPQEKVDLFDDDNLDKFRDSITPKRVNNKRAETNSSENDKLPTLSEIHAETNRKERGRSIIKELVNDRAYVLLSTQKKNKNKKRKTKDDLSECIDDENNDSSDTNKKKKKKKSKKKDANEIYEEDESLGKNEDFEKNKKINEKVDKNDYVNNCSSEVPIPKKSKKNKLKDIELSVDDENSEARKKKGKRNVELNDVESEQSKTSDISGDNIEKKKKKNRKISELCAETPIEIEQEIQEEKRKKKIKRNFETSLCAENDLNALDPDNTDVDINEDRKKKKIKRNTEKSLSVEERRCEKNYENIEILDGKKKKKTKNISEVNDESNDIVEKETNLGRGDKELNIVVEQFHVQEICEERKKKKNKRAEITSTFENHNEIQKEDAEGVIDEKLVKIEKELLEEKTEHAHTTSAKLSQIPIESVKTEKDELNMTKDAELDTLGDTTKEETLPEIIQQKSGVDNSSIELNYMENLQIQEHTSNVERVEPVLKDDIPEVYVENQTDIGNDYNSDCVRKRKKESSISESVTGLNEIKKRKFSIENRSEQIVEVLEIESVECSERTVSMEPDKKENIEGKCKSIKENNSSETAVRIEDPDINDKGENLYHSEVLSHPVSQSGGPMLVVDNEGNIDMKLTSVFTSSGQLPFSNDFSKDVDISNFYDKNTSWNNDPSRFRSYNDSLFNDMNKESSLIIVGEDKSADNNPSDLVSVVNEISNEVLTEVKKESNAEENRETHESIVVKIEEDAQERKEPEPKTVAFESQPKTSTVTESEPKASAEEFESQPNSSFVTVDSQPKTSSVTFESQPKTSFVTSLPTTTADESVTTATYGAPSMELPNDIEEIVREKDNLDTVKRLCEFLEEVRDPEDVLKKVLLLKKAFSENNHDSVVPNKSSETTRDDDVLSISSSGSSVVFCNENFIVEVDDDITLANCDITDIENESSKTFLEESSKENTSETVEIVMKTPKKNDKTKFVQSTECAPGTSKNISSRTELKIREHRGLDEYEVEDVQDLMSDNPQLWKIVAEDAHPIRLLGKGKRCIKCREIGHLGYNCPNRLKLPRCSLCGLEGHLDFKCPNRLCIQCGRKTPMMQNVCEHCKHYKNITCTMCKNKGHPKNKCPDLWRRYHLTVSHGPLVKGSVLKLKDKEHLWCSSCAKSGHVESECAFSWLKSRNFQPLDPRIHYYEDIYKVTPVPDNEDFIQPNFDEVPETSTNLLRESDSSSSSSSDDTKDKKEITFEIPTEETLDMNQSGQSAPGGLEDLPPGFEVIDEVNEEKNEMKSYVGNSEINEFFMTATNEEIREFLEKEIRLLETSKFDIKNIHMRFFAFVEDNKLPEHKRRFKTKTKENFFKSLNMLLFGKLQVKAGKVHKDKLKYFLDSPLRYLSNYTRETLCFSYDYIFRNSVHEHVNYKFFLKMVRNKHGHKKWLF